MEKGLVIFGVLTIGALIFFGIKWEKQWQEFSKEHNCVEIGYQTGSVGVGTGVSASGQAVTSTVYIAGKTGYACDDGKQYWR